VEARIEAALKADRTIDIVTIGRKSGEPRTTEIWFFDVAGRTVITGTPGKRDWYANLLVNPEFDFCLKESINKTLKARAIPVTDIKDRHQIFSAKETIWYRQQVTSISELVGASPLVEVEFLQV
jgi:deazaflavin-dependent oxidoreductase (nitroreductase family)